MERIVGEDAVERVRQASDIVEVLGTYLDLRPAGRSFKACCPFHKEKTPSFHVSPDRQLFHCFGCEVGGDVFSFVMKHDGLTFPEALEKLARRAGVELPERSGPRGPDRGKLIEAHREAVRYYRAALGAPTGESARQYLGERGTPETVLGAYYVGYAPGTGQALLEFLRKKFPVELLVAAGLVGQADGGRLYDRFRDRVVIPILSVAGDPIGFGARSLRPDAEPKYLNTPETAIYKKGRILFGLPQARAAIKDEGRAIVVEGYFDALAMSSAGLHAVVAPCGTAWTMDHARLLLRYTPRIVFLFDGDPAGEKAAWRALEATLPIQAEIGIVVLPSGMDPDDMVRGGNSDELVALLREPMSPVGFALDSLRRQGVDGPPGMRRIAALLAIVGNVVSREMMIDEAAEKGRIAARVLRQEVERLLAQRPRARRTRPETESPEGPVRLAPLEEAVLRLVVARPDAVGVIREAARGVAGLREGVRELLTWIDDRTRSGQAPEPPEMLRRIGHELGDQIEVGFLLTESPLENSDQFREDLVRHLREQALEAQLETLGYEIRGLEAEGGHEDKLAVLLARKLELARELSQLRGGSGAGRTESTGLRP